MPPPSGGPSQAYLCFHLAAAIGLVFVQAELRAYTLALSEIAGVEDLTDFVVGDEAD